MGGVGLNAKMGGRDHSVAVSVMVIMIAMTMQLPTTSDCTMYSQISTSISTGNATWCDGHINMDGKCMQLNTKNTNNIADDQLEGDLDWDLDLKYVMVDMGEYYSETTFVTRFLDSGDPPVIYETQTAGNPICGLYTNNPCNPPKNPPAAEQP